MLERDKFNGASVAELVKRMEDLKLSFAAFDRDLRGSDELKVRLAELSVLVTKGKKSKGPVFASETQLEALRLAEDFSAFLRAAAASPLANLRRR